MNQDSSFPPMLPPSTELGALLFAVLPCLQETYRPLASFAYHMTELTKLKNIPAIPPLTGLSGIEALITDKDIMFRSLSFYGRMFRMPLLSTIATLLQGMQFYQAYKDILPGLFTGMGGLGGFGNNNSSEGSSPDLFSMLGGLSPDMMSSLFSGFSGGFSSSGTGHASSATGASDRNTSSPDSSDNITSESAPSAADEALPPSSNESDPYILPEASPLPDSVPPTTASVETSEPLIQPEYSSPTDDLYSSLYSFLTPEQQKIYEQLMHTD